MFLTIIIFILILGLLVFVHEFGHFITAKKMGVGVEEFGFGFPPRIAGVYRNPQTKKFHFIFGKGKRTAPLSKKFTIYSINWIPLGGFVKIKGETGEYRGETDSFASKKIWQRSSILIAGVFMNFVLAAVLLSAGLMIGLPHVLDDDKLSGARIREEYVQIAAVLKDSPAKENGLIPGDIILKFDERQLKDPRELQEYTSRMVGQPINLLIKRGEEEIYYKITARVLSETGQEGIGVGLIKTGIVSYPWYLAIGKGLGSAVFFTKAVLVAFGELIKNLVLTGEVAVELSGPVGIAVITGRVARLGLIYLLQFTALLSINLAIINVLPFPALDGGRLLFLGIEGIRRKPISQKVENIVHNIGFLLLMLLVILVTYRDVMQYADKFINIGKRIFTP